MTLHRYLPILVFLFSAPSFAQIEDGGWGDGYNGDFYVLSGDGSGYFGGEPMVTIEIVAPRITDAELAEIQAALAPPGEPAQTVTVIGSRLKDSVYSYDIDGWADYALMTATQVADRNIGQVTTSTAPAAKTTSAQTAAAAQARVRQKAAQDRAKLNQIDKSFDRCRPGNSYVLNAIAEYNVQGAENYSCGYANGQYQPNTDLCIAKIEAGNVASQYGYANQTYLELRATNQALQAEMVSLASWANGIIESCDL